MNDDYDMDSLLNYTPSRTLDMYGLSDRNATVVKVTYVDYDGRTGSAVSATGASKREQGDVYSEPLGYKFALARALQNLSRDLMRQARTELKAVGHHPVALP